MHLSLSFTAAARLCQEERLTVRPCRCWPAHLRPPLPDQPVTPDHVRLPLPCEHSSAQGCTVADSGRAQMGPSTEETTGHCQTGKVLLRRRSLELVLLVNCPAMLLLQTWLLHKKA